MEDLNLRGIELVSQRPLYHGAFTEIYQARYRGEYVSVKRYRQFSHLNDSLKTASHKINVDRFMLEVQIMIRVQSPHVLRFIGACSDAFSTPCLVSPWMDNGTIRTYMNEKGAANTNLEKRLTELASAIDYVHSQGVVHNAISASTVLIKSDGTSCLGGFGLAISTESDYDFDSGVGEYIAPELMDSRHAATTPVDIYAFGCLSFLLYTGKSPPRPFGMKLSWPEEIIRPLRYADPGVAISEDMWDLLCRCWRKNPGQRATAKDVNRFMENLNQQWNTGAWKLIESHLARWMFDKDAKRLCWVENSGSTNTSYIARSMAELCAREERLAASLFFIPGSGVTRIDLLSILAGQLMHEIPMAQRFIQKVLTETPAILKPNSPEELQNLLSRIFLQPLAILGNTIMPPKVIVIDSLDMWEKAFDSDSSKWFTTKILMDTLLWLSESLQQHQLPLRIFVTSSPGIRQNAKTSNSEFQNICFCLYLYPRGVLDSDKSIDVWQELRRLSASDAGYDADLEYSSASRTPEDILVKISNWCNGTDSQRICWLKHPFPMYGQRSLAAKLVARQCLGRKALAAFIFCPSTMDAGSFLPTLALQLVDNVVASGLKAEMKRIIESNREILIESNGEAFVRAVIIDALLKFRPLPPMFIVIDCTGWSGGQLLLTQLMWLDQAFRHHDIPFRLFITSEPELFSTANLHFSMIIDSALVLQFPSMDLWDAPQAPAETIEPETVDLGNTLFNEASQVIYQNLAMFLALKIYAYHRDDQILCEDFKDCIDHMSQLDKVNHLVESDQYRSRLLQISSSIGFSGHADVRKALEKDDILLAGLLKDLLKSNSEKELILSLKNESAHKCLDVLQLVLSKGLLDAPEDVRKTRQLFIRLSQNAEIILHSQLISGLTMLNNGQAVNGGGYADIFRAVFQGKEVAVKRIRNHLGRDSLRIRRAFAQEALVWQHLRHPNVLPFLGIDSEMFTSSLCMVSPWMKNGTIMEFRAVIGPSNMAIDQRLIEIVDGLRYLHEEGVIHGDLRGGNILVDDEWHAVLADFGLTVFGDSTMTSTTHETNPRGTTRWMAPELLNPEISDLDGLRKTEASDVYAFGCVCLELYTGRPPFADTMNEAAVICQLVQGKQSPINIFPDNHSTEHGALPIPEHINTIITRCWSRAPKERPCSAEVMKILREVPADSI